MNSKRKTSAFIKALSTLVAINSPLTIGSLMASDQGLSISPGYSYFNFDNDLGFDDNGAGSIGVEYHLNNHWAIGANYAKSETETLANASDLDFSYARLDGFYHFNQISNFITPYLSVGAGESEQEFGDNLTIDETLVNFGGGLRFLLAEGLSVVADIRGINSIDAEKTSSLATVGLSYLFGQSGSGSSSEGGFDISEQETLDSEDSDSDSIADIDDQCPNTPEGVVVDNTGCGLDGDYDGVADYQDQCAETPENAPVDSKGCPSDLDSDGIADYQDDCNNTAAGKIVDASGCALTLSKNIQFKSNSTQIGSDLKSEVQELANFLRRYENTIAVIEGHTDASGNTDHNAKLAADRAKAVEQVLIEEFGIDPSRLKTASYGESRPLASNLTTEGRNQNRRATATIIQQ